MRLRVQKQIELPSFVQGSSSDNSVSSNNCSSWDEYSISYFGWDESSADSSYFDDDNDDDDDDDDDYQDELDVIVARGVVWFRLFEKWQSVPNEQWAWMYLVAVDDDGVRYRLWAPRLLLNDYREYEFWHKRRPLLRPSPSRQHTPSTEEAVASLVFNFIHNGNFDPWWTSDDSSGYTTDDFSGYTDRELVRTCRLVCRDWAKRTPLGDPKLTVTNGVVWHHVEDEWQALPKRHWAWVFQKIDWWVERRQQDNVGWKRRDECKAWYLKLIQPIDESVRPKYKEKSVLSSLIVTSKPYRTRLEPLFGPRFLQNVRDMDNRKLYRTCRLVCRDWARQFPVTDPDERGKLWLREGVMRYWTEGDWHTLPNTCWTWTFQATEWWAERCCPGLSCCAEMGCKGKGWYPNLMQPVNNPESLTLPVQPHKCWRLPLPPSGQHTHSTEETLGSLVFDFIYNNKHNTEDWFWSDAYSYPDRELVRMCRLVCRDWAKRAPLGDPKLTVTNGVVLHCVEDEWQALPQRHWAWVFQKIEWWVERRQQDSVWCKRRKGCKAWYPKLIQPIDESVRPKSEEKSALSSLNVTRKQYRTHLDPCFGPRFLQNVRDMDNRKLYRTCRLVCRDWARQFPVTDPEQSKLWLREGVMRYWIEGDWHTLPNTCWAWTFQATEWWAERCCPDLSRYTRKGCKGKGWYPKLMQPVSNPESLILPVQPHKCWRLPLPPSGQHSPEETVGSLVFDFIHSSDFNPECWKWTRHDSYGYKDRELVRRCRLVCRDWAKRAPLGDPKLTVTSGVVLRRVEDEWQALPKRHWAWVFQKIEWWVERRQDNDGWKSRDECKAWYPKLIQPIDESVRPKNKEKSALSSMIVTSKSYRTCLEPLFGPRFLQNVRDMNHRKLYRTCRLVCRDWARQFPVTDPERGKLWLREGVMRYWTEGVWHILPNTFWTWTFQATEWWAEGCCSDLSYYYANIQCKGKKWYPKLMQPVNNPKRLILPVQPHKPWQLPLPLSGQHSPEETVASLVFNFIYNIDFNPGHYCWAIDDASGYTDRELGRTCRLVCRDWAKRVPLGDPKLTVTNGVVWHRVEDEWQALPQSHWTWVFHEIEWWVERRQQDKAGWKRRKECKAWYPKLILPIDDTMLSKGKGRWNMSLPPVTKKQFRTRLEPSIGRRFLQNVRDLDYRELYRTCRLVCHEWARRYPVSKPELCNFNFSGGTMQYWLADDWHPLPPKYWAWTIEDVEWWTRCQFRTFSSQKLGCKSKGWRPKLIQDVDESILKWGFSPTLATDSLEWGPGMDRLLLHRWNSSGTRIRDVPAAMKMIGSWTFGFICRSGLDRYSCNDEERKLGRTCRLVCRDWARELPLGDPQLKVAEGVVWYHFEEGWQHLPKSYWAWTRQGLQWWMEPRQQDVAGEKDRDECRAWFPRLIQSVNDLIQSKGKDRSMTLSSMALPAKLLCAHLEASDPLTHPSQQLVQPFGDCIGQDLSIAPFPARRHRRTTSVASALPPELFKYICNAADWGSWSSRLVCRYWNEQCTPHVFTDVRIWESPVRIRALWRFSRDPTWPFMSHVKKIVGVPKYDRESSRFPWVHLLTQTSLSVGFAWDDENDLGNSIVIEGPFHGGHRTIRSIHFGLPRSPPPSFSRGIRFLALLSIKFNRFADLANLVCELPDLEELWCLDASFALIPTELAHRRPRRCRNNLRMVGFARQTADPAPDELLVVPLLLTGMSLYLSVYDVASFFSANEIAASIALMQPYREYDSFVYIYTQNSTSRKLIFGFREDDDDHPFQVLLYSSQGTLKLGVAFDMTTILKAWKEADWQRFDNMVRTARSQMPSVPIHAIFGFGKRKEMLEFAETLPSRMPAVAGETTLHYAMKRNNAGRGSGWYQASLDSEELRGEPNRELRDVYPIEALGSS